MAGKPIKFRQMSSTGFTDVPSKGAIMTASGNATPATRSNSNQAMTHARNYKPGGSQTSVFRGGANQNRGFMTTGGFSNSFKQSSNADFHAHGGHVMAGQQPYSSFTNGSAVKA